MCTYFTRRNLDRSSWGAEKVRQRFSTAFAEETTIFILSNRIYIAVKFWRL